MFVRTQLQGIVGFYRGSMTKNTVVLAIMFADLSHSTKETVSSAATDSHAIVSQCIAVLKRACKAHGGTFIKTVGDGIMCTYKTAANAIDAAMEMQSVVAGAGGSELSGQFAPGVHIGIDFGQMISENGDVFGNAVNVAARMVKLANRRQIVVTQHLVAALPKKYAKNCRSIDNVLVKGKSNRLKVFEVVWEADKLTVEINVSGGSRSQIKRYLELQYGEKTFVMSDSRPTVTIGRLLQNDIVVDDKRVSRFHARIEYRREKYYLVDQSSNGCYLKDEEADSSVFVQNDEAWLRSNGMLDLCLEQPDRSSETAIFYSHKYCQVTGPE